MLTHPSCQVLNHRCSADKKEKVKAIEVDQNDQNTPLSDPYEIEAWVGFDFPGRGDKYSSQKYHWYHFTGTDFNAANDKEGLFKFQGEGTDWAESVEEGDDFLLGEMSYTLIFTTHLLILTRRRLELFTPGGPIRC
jgi:alpha-amylase